MQRLESRKVLVFHSRKLSYESGKVFLDEIGKALTMCGYDVEYCYLKSVEEDAQKLMSYIGKTYTAVLDVNSELPVATWDGQYYLDCIHAPFFNLLLDHPIHLQERLAVPLKEYYAICIDAQHAAYIEEHYTHIKKAFVMPYAGTKAQKVVPFEERSMDILFPATYAPLSFFEGKIKQAGTDIWKMTEQMMELMQQERLNFWQAYERIMEIEQIEKRKEIDARLAYADRYIRMWNRERALDSLLKAGREVHVVGINWDLYDGADSKQLCIHPAVDYRQVIEMEANAKIVFNVQPSFVHGPHDRIMNAMINGAVAFTDECDYLKNHFCEGEEYLAYDLSDCERIPEIIGEMFQKEERPYQIGQQAEEKMRAHHTWTERVKALIQDVTR